MGSSLISYFVSIIAILRLNGNKIMGFPIFLLRNRGVTRQGLL